MGVATGDMGRRARRTHKPDYQPGLELTKYTSLQRVAADTSQRK